MYRMKAHTLLIAQAKPQNHRTESKIANKLVCFLYICYCSYNVSVCGSEFGKGVFNLGPL